MKLRLLRVQPRFLQAAANLRLVEAKKVNAAIRARGHGARHSHGIDVSGTLHGAHIGKSRPKCQPVVDQRRAHPNAAASIAVAAPRLPLTSATGAPFLPVALPLILLPYRRAAMNAAPT